MALARDRLTNDRLSGIWLSLPRGCRSRRVLPRNRFIGLALSGRNLILWPLTLWSLSGLRSPILRARSLVGKLPLRSRPILREVPLRPLSAIAKLALRPMGRLSPLEPSHVPKLGIHLSVGVTPPADPVPLIHVQFKVVDVENVGLNPLAGPRVGPPSSLFVPEGDPVGLHGLERPRVPVCAGAEKIQHGRVFGHVLGKGVVQVRVALRIQFALQKRVFLLLFGRLGLLGGGVVLVRGAHL